MSVCFISCIMNMIPFDPDIMNIVGWCHPAAKTDKRKGMCHMRTYGGRCLCLLLIIVMLSGCGGNVAGENRAGVDKAQTGVSETAVSGQAADVQNGRRADTYKYCTENYLYRKYKHGVIQCRLDGTEEKKVPVRKNWGNEADIIEIKDGWLYYSDSDWDNYAEVIARIPIRTEADDTETLNVDATEALLKDEDDSNVYMKIDAPYIIYMGERPIRYNWESGEKKVLAEQNMQQEEFWRNSWISVCSDKNAYISVFDRGLYRLNWNTEELVKIGEYPVSGDAITIFVGDRYLIYSPYKDGSIGIDIWMYDETEDRGECLVSEEQVAQMIQKEKGLRLGEDIDLLDCTDLFYDNNRLYLQIQMNWWEDNKYHVECLMFSRELTADALPRYEKELTECISRTDTVKKEMWSGTHAGKEYPVYVKRSRCWQMAGGKAFFIFQDKSGKKKLGCFDLSTGGFKIPAKNESEYYMIYYNQESQDVTTVFGEHIDMKWESGYST